MTVSSLQYPAVSVPLTSGLRRLEDQQATLQASLASGVRSEDYAGLGADRRQVLDLAPSVTRLDAWRQNVAGAQTTLSVTQTAISSIAALVTNIHSTLVGLEGRTDPASITAATTQARSSLSALANLVNTRSGSDYIFAGTAADTAPIPSPDRINKSDFVSTIAAAVVGMAATGAAAARTAATSAAANNTSGQSLFAPALSLDPVTASTLSRGIPVDDDMSVGIGIVATQGTAAATATSTGAPLRDLFGLLATVSQLGSADPTSQSFSDLVSNLGSWSDDIGNQLTGIAASLGTDQNVLTQRSTSLSLTSDALTTQLGTLRDSDAAALSVQTTTVQNQLTASYNLVADSKQLSLANFL